MGQLEANRQCVSAVGTRGKFPVIPAESYHITRKHRRTGYRPRVDDISVLNRKGNTNLARDVHFQRLRRIAGSRTTDQCARTRSAIACAIRRPRLSSFYQSGRGSGCRGRFRLLHLPGCCRLRFWRRMRYGRADRGWSQSWSRDWCRFRYLEFRRLI